MYLGWWWGWVGEVKWFLCLGSIVYNVFDRIVVAKLAPLKPLKCPETPTKYWFLASIPLFLGVLRLVCGYLDAIIWGSDPDSHRYLGRDVVWALKYCREVGRLVYTGTEKRVILTMRCTEGLLPYWQSMILKHFSFKGQTRMVSNEDYACDNLLAGSHCCCCFSNKMISLAC